MERWYFEYWAQTWYRNTFLVRWPGQIGREIGKPRDWNNVHDSGCNFVCVAMILGIEPARLASHLSRRRYFAADRGSRGLTLAGRVGGLVWDQNRPHESDRTMRVAGVWDTRRGRRVTFTLRFVAAETAREHAEGVRIVARARQRGEHVICGPQEHAHLVAGRRGRDFYVWDPDETTIAVEDSLAGRFGLRRLFALNASEPIEFWRYELTVRAAKSAARGRKALK